MTKRGKKAKHKGVACRRGQPIFYEEMKAPRNFSLTQTAVDNLEIIRIQRGLSSRSETLEQILRGEFNPQTYLSLKSEGKSID